MPAYCDNAADDKLFNFSDPQGNQPATLQSRFYPGDNFGVTFHAAKGANETRQVSGANGKPQNAGNADTAAQIGN
jgi:hypothetical protein